MHIERIERIEPTLCLLKNALIKTYTIRMDMPNYDHLPRNSDPNRHAGENPRNVAPESFEITAFVDCYHKSSTCVTNCDIFVYI
jgi:hypothetical protein